MDNICESCGASFTRSYNVLRHQRESCVARFSVVGVEKRRRIDGAASTSAMMHCVTCNIDVPSSYMAAHQRTLEHKNNSGSPISHGVQVIQCAFKGRIVSYRINSNNEHTDYATFFTEIKSEVFNVINEALRIHHALKVNMVAVGMYFLPSQDTKSEKSFNTPNQIITVGGDLEQIYQFFVEVMKTKSTEFAEKDSGKG